MWAPRMFMPSGRGLVPSSTRMIDLPRLEAYTREPGSSLVPIACSLSQLDSGGGALALGFVRAQELLVVACKLLEFVELFGGVRLPRVGSFHDSPFIRNLASAIIGKHDGTRFGEGRSINVSRVYAAGSAGCVASGCVGCDCAGCSPLLAGVSSLVAGSVLGVVCSEGVVCSSGCG